MCSDADGIVSPDKGARMLMASLNAVVTPVMLDLGMRGAAASGIDPNKGTSSC